MSRIYQIALLDQGIIALHNARNTFNFNRVFNLSSTNDKYKKIQNRTDG